VEEPPEHNARPTPGTPLVEAAGALIKEAEGRLDAIEAAIAAVEAGSYGRCEICGTEIEAERLAVRASEARCAAHREPTEEARLF
jgi:RNA polymerase-binding transcription factor DksA